MEDYNVAEDLIGTMEEHKVGEVLTGSLKNEKIVECRIVDGQNVARDLTGWKESHSDSVASDLSASMEGQKIGTNLTGTKESDNAGENINGSVGSDNVTGDLTSSVGGGWREYQAVLTLYLGIIVEGYNMGFSAIAIPSIQLEANDGNTTYSIPSVIASMDQL